MRRIQYSISSQAQKLLQPFLMEGVGKGEELERQQHAESAWITTSLQSASFGRPNSRVSEHKILYLFCDGIYLRLRPELRAHPAATTVQAA
jgi:hypothetical protein